MSWISVRNWRKFQHYDPEKRRPPWIKNYTDLMSDDAYLQLTAGERAVLHGVWLEYASSQCRLRFNTVSLTRRLNMRVTRYHLKALVDAGWIEVVASAALAEGYLAASPRAHDVEVEVEVDLKNKPFPTPTSTYNGAPAELPNLEDVLKDMPL